MDRIEQCTGELVKAILESEPYNEYLKAKEMMNMVPEKMDLSNYLRKKNYELQEQESGGAFSTELEEFAYEVAVNRQDEEIDAYLAAEQRMCRILQNVFKQIVNRVELDLDFLDEPRRIDNECQ